MRFYLPLTVVIFCLCRYATAFPAWNSLVGRSDEEISAFARTVTITGAQPAPGPLNNTLSMLVNDAAHQYMPPGPNDIRGPCPGLNTLASHGVGLFNYFIVILFNIFVQLDST